MPGHRRLAPLVVVLVAIAASIWLLQGGPFGGSGVSGEPPTSSSQAARVGSPARDFVLRDLDGNPVHLSALRDNRVVLNFWATWCPPCRAEMPDLDRVDREYRDSGVLVLTVDQMESRETVGTYPRELDLQLTAVIDTLGETARLYRVSALPATLFIDKRWVLRETTSVHCASRAFSMSWIEPADLAVADTIGRW